MFELPEEHRMLQDLVAKFVDRDVIPLEKAVLAREMSGQTSGLSDEEEDTLLAKCKELGLWGLDVPEEYRRRQPALPSRWSGSMKNRAAPACRSPSRPTAPTCTC